MNSLKCMLACVSLLVADAGAQISGTFKITKVASDTLVEQIKLDADKSADVVYGGTTLPRVTKEVRGRYVAMTIEKLITVFQKETQMEEGPKKTLARLLQFKDGGYDLFVWVMIPGDEGKEIEMRFVHKGSDLVDFKSGEIFRKSMWPF